MPDVHIAPDAVLFSRCKTVGEADVVDFFSDSINPTVAQRFIQRLRVRYAAFAGILAIESDPELARLVVIPFEPSPEIGARAKEAQIFLADLHEVRRLRQTGGSGLRGMPACSPS